jgi:hypothetical protein
VRAFSHTSRQRPRFRAWIEEDWNWRRSSPRPPPALVTSTEVTAFFSRERRRLAGDGGTPAPTFSPP